MKVQGQSYRTIWTTDTEPGKVFIIDQRMLPHEFKVITLDSLEDAAHAIKDMAVRGAPLIGATAAYGMYLAVLEFESGDLSEHLKRSAEILNSTRPTAVNLKWGTDRMLRILNGISDPKQAESLALIEAQKIADEDVEICRMIGVYGLKLIEELHQKNPDRPVNILTHCNAGWLATIDWGTATSPIYHAHQKGIPVHVWVDETRPRNQGASLTAFELKEMGVPHTVIVDNAGGHLMQHGMVDCCIVGTDRTTAHGDVANKIGTYLKALAAKDNNVPFYVALPSPTIDWELKDGVREIPIEQRDGREVSHIRGSVDSQIKEVLLTPEGSPVANYAFDVTPAHLVSGLITERGVCEASKAGLRSLFDR